MELLQYKGYTASVEVDLEANIIYGRVLNLRDGIDFQAERVADLQREFEASVDEYLAWCAEDGREPDKPFSGKFLVRLDPALHREAALGAVRASLSLNEWMKAAVQEKLKGGAKPMTVPSASPNLVELSQVVEQMQQAMRHTSLLGLGPSHKIGGALIGGPIGRVVGEVIDLSTGDWIETEELR